MNSKTKQVGDTPLHLASIAGRADAVRLLVGAGADVNARNRSERTPLHCSLRVRKRDYFRKSELSPIPEILLRHGADVDAKGGSRDETALHLAARNCIEVGYIQVK